MVRSVPVACLLTGAAGHAWLTEPPSRTGATLAGAGLCPYGACLWFSQSCTIGCPECGGIEGNATCGEQQGAATLPHEMRTFNLNDDCGVNPWCAPGSSPVMNPCGVSAGGDAQGSKGNGNDKPPGYDYAALGTEMRNGADEHRTWKVGEAVDVAFAIIANHGGGYQYRLCPKDAEQTEECFQRTPLEFVGDDQWIQYCSLEKFNLPADATPDGFNGTKRVPPSEAFPKCDLNNRQKIPAKRTNIGTIPEGSTWARNPIPACDNFLGGSFNYGCLVSSIEGKYPIPTADKFQFAPPGDDLYRPGLLLGGFGGGACEGCNQPDGNNPPGCDKYGKEGQNNCTVDEAAMQFFPWNVLDQVLVPDVPPGEYVVSFRWDCEQTPQIWQQCSDVTIVAGDTPSPTPPSPTPPAPAGCPGGSFPACISLCPSDPEEFKECMAECSKRCDEPPSPSPTPPSPSPTPSPAPSPPAPDPCDICVTGACASCEPCVSIPQSYQPCAPCWEKQADGTACLPNCQACWKTTLLV